jgi:methylated-DNA-[protein]-cysteine S-methyltransferase
VNQFYTIIPSPIGEITLIASNEALQAVLFNIETPKAHENAGHPILKKTAQQLAEYFAGKRKDFDLPLSTEGTAFQKKAWAQLMKIPYGKTISYGEQAEKLGDSKKARAVGTANSQNPISIIVPCHRVIAKSGALTGYSGGLSVKKFLLQLEQGNLPRS